MRGVEFAAPRDLLLTMNCIRNSVLCGCLGTRPDCMQSKEASRVSYTHRRNSIAVTIHTQIQGVLLSESGLNGLEGWFVVCGLWVQHVHVAQTGINLF